VEFKDGFRQYAALEILKIRIADNNLTAQQSAQNPKYAVMVADALIAELNKQNETP
jgi:hypothetical protein